MSAKSFFLAALIGLIGVAPAPSAHPADAISVLTPSRVIFALPYWIAERKGYFKDEDIEPKLELIADGREMTRRLLDGTAQFSIGGPDAALIDAPKGGPLRILAGIVRKPPLYLIAQRSIRSFADLRGATIGVLSLTEGSSKLLIRMAEAEGLSRGDFTIKAVGGAPARQIMLQQGQIDAGIQPLPLSLEAEAYGLDNLGWAGKYQPDWQFITVNANNDWARNNPRVATGFLRALLRAERLIWSSPDEAAQIAAEALQTPPVMAMSALEDAKGRGILDPRLDWSERGLQLIYEGMQADGVIPAGQKFDLGKVTDASYLRQAQALVEGKP